jgi:hypothetical protein
VAEEDLEGWELQEVGEEGEGLEEEEAEEVAEVEARQIGRNKTRIL